MRVVDPLMVNDVAGSPLTEAKMLMMAATWAEEGEKETTAVSCTLTEAGAAVGTTGGGGKGTVPVQFTEGAYPSENWH